MPDLSSADSKKLLDIARRTLSDQIKTGEVPRFVIEDPPLLLTRGCFVTLYKHGSLRGCVGTFDASKPLYQNVMRMVLAAAFQDTRFQPLSKEELPLIRLEISVLGKLEKIHSPEEIEISRHGVLVRYGQQSGTYLPSVARDQGWDAWEFVMRCAREKAGLTPEECAQAEIYRYAVEKISE